MLITKFGSTYAGALAFDLYQSVDGLGTARPAVVAEVDGSAGSFDFWGDENFPIASQSITKSYTLLGSSYADVDVDLDALKADTLCIGRNKLWALMRDSSKRWSWAKCTSLAYSEAYNDRTRALKVDLAFMLESGAWYAESETNLDEGGASFNITNSGNAPAGYRLDFYAYSAPPGTYTIAVANTTNGTGFTFVGSIAASKHLIIDTGAFTCLNDGANAYANLTPVKPTNWLTLEPGVNAMTLSFNGLATDIDHYWYNTWL